MAVHRDEMSACLDECTRHLNEELLPFWLDRCRDTDRGGFITHFDRDGRDTGEDEKSMLAQMRTIYAMASAHRAGYGDGRCAEYARHGVDFVLDRLWDTTHGGFYWTCDRSGQVTNDQKILYGHSFAMYALSEYTLADGDPRGRESAEAVFDLVKKYCSDTLYGGYYEMFERDWRLCGPGSGGGDRKTLDVHMHLMEAFTALYECTGDPLHRRTLEEAIQLLVQRILHPEHGTGIPQFRADWQVAPQIKFDVVWGWDRFTESGQKAHAEDNTSAGHNVEFGWLLARATDVLQDGWDRYRDVVRKAIDHGRDHGIDLEYGGVYTEGPQAGGVYDTDKEFWQQAEMMVGMLEASLRFGPEAYWEPYRNVHRFVFDKAIHHPVGEWWPLLNRKGEPIWTHMSHSWKVNYHTIRCMVQCIDRLKKLLDLSAEPTDSTRGDRSPCGHE